MKNRKFIIVTDMRDPVGVEELVGRKIVLNVDHIISVEAVEAQIAEHMNYNSVITTVNDKCFLPIETQAEVVEKMFSKWLDPQ